VHEDSRELTTAWEFAWEDRSLELRTAGPPAGNVPVGFELTDVLGGDAVSLVSRDGTALDEIRVRFADGLHVRYVLPSVPVEELSADVFARTEIRVGAGRSVRVYTADNMPERVRSRLVQLGQARESWMKQKHADPRIYLAPGVGGPANRPGSNPLKFAVETICGAARGALSSGTLTPPTTYWVLGTVIACDIICAFVGWGC